MSFADSGLRLKLTIEASQPVCSRDDVAEYQTPPGLVKAAVEPSGTTG